MTTIESFKAQLRCQADQQASYIEDAIRQNGDEATFHLARQIAQDTLKLDLQQRPAAAFIGHLALLALSNAWLTVMEDELNPSSE